MKLQYKILPISISNLTFFEHLIIAWDNRDKKKEK